MEQGGEEGEGQGSGSVDVSESGVVRKEGRELRSIAVVAGVPGSDVVEELVSEENRCIKI
jgi:hypothetical protein